MRGLKANVKCLVLLGFGLVIATPALAQVGDTASYTSAMHALITKIGDAGTVNVAPASTDPVLVRATHEAEALRIAIGTPKLRVTALSTMNTLCVPPLAVMKGFFAIGLDSRMKTASTDAERKAIRDKVETENAARYADTILPFMLLNVRCNASHMPVIETFLAGIPVNQLTSAQMDGIAQIRGGANEQVQGLISNASDPATSEASRLRVLGELARDIDLMLIGLTPADKAGVMASLVKLRPSLSPAGKAQADIATTKLAKGGCGKLCAVVVPAH